MTKVLETIWAWTDEDPGGGEGVILAFIPLLGIPGNLQHRNRKIAEMFRALAYAHGERTGHTVLLVRFDRVEEVERYNPPTQATEDPPQSELH